MKLRTHGLLAREHVNQAEAAMQHPGVFYKAMMDRHALWDPQTIEDILADFPKGYVDEADLFLILAECIANSTLHGQAEALGFYARMRGGMVLVSFYQIPPLQRRVALILSLARSGSLRDVADDLPGGLGFPILLRLVRRITLSGDGSRLQLWLKRQA